jgi:DNA-binding NarL/FixJ family response regulator
VYPQSPFHRMLSLGTTRRTLTAQQQRILQLLRRGCDTRQIASELNRSPDTIRVHLGRIHSFFGVKNRHELLARLSAEVTDSTA